MSKKSPEQSERPRGSSRPSLSARLEAVRYLNSSSARRTTPVQHIADALVAAGYTTLDQQAKALGIHRATAWTIIRTKHKLGYLNAKTTERMLTNPELPPCIRDILQRYKSKDQRLSASDELRRCPESVASQVNSPNRHHR
jgi:hypothetical protein